MAGQRNLTSDQNEKRNSSSKRPVGTISSAPSDAPHLIPISSAIGRKDREGERGILEGARCDLSDISASTVRRAGSPQAASHNRVPVLHGRGGSSAEGERDGRPNGVEEGTGDGGREGWSPTALRPGSDVVRCCGGPASLTARGPGDPTSAATNSGSGQQRSSTGRRGAWRVARKVRQIQIGGGGRPPCGKAGPAAAQW